MELGAETVYNSGVERRDDPGPDRVTLGGRRLGRRALTLTGVGSTGMWGERLGRRNALETIRAAVDRGADLVEVPLPFGPFADLARDADLGGVYLVARLTGPVRSLEVLEARLGRRPDLLLADPGLLPALSRWPVDLGAVTADGGVPAVPGVDLKAVRGPFPAPPGRIESCRHRGVAYLAPSLGVLGAGRATVALLAPHSPTEAAALFGRPGATPPDAAPG